MIAATHAKEPKVIWRLVHRDALLESRDPEGRTALMWAAWKSEKPEIIGALTSAGARVSARDRQGRTALDYLLMNDTLRDNSRVKARLD
jgi:ankyrin repeat protein